jgi:hypothetical protein
MTLISLWGSFKHFLEMSTQLIQWLSDGAPGSHPVAHHLFFAHQSELFGEILSAEDVGRLVGICDRSIRNASKKAIEREPGECYAMLECDSTSKRTIPLLLNSDGTVLRIEKEFDSRIGREEICFAIISSPRSRGRGRPPSKSGDSGWKFRCAYTVKQHENFLVPPWVGRQ